MIAIDAVATPGETSALCQSIGIARASLYRHRQPARPAVSVSDPRPSPRALGPAERQAILDALHSERFVDQLPAEVHATLLEEQTYLGSVRTMYRGMSGVGSQARAVADLEDGGRATVMHVGRREIVQAAVMMRVVVPREEIVANDAGIFAWGDRRATLDRGRSGPRLG